MEDPRNFEYLDDFLSPVSEEIPCGSCFDDDEVYLRIERNIESANESREWVSLKKEILPLLKKTKDFRLLAFYCRALVNTEKTPFLGLVDSLVIAKSYIENNWDCVYPVEDVEDEDDRFTDRLNAIGELGAWTTIVLPLTKKRVLLSFKGMPEYSLGDLLAFQRGEVVEGKQAPKQFVKALPEDEFSQVTNILATAQMAHDISSAIKSRVTEKLDESFIEFDKYLFVMLDDVISVLTDLSNEKLGKGISNVDLDEGKSSMAVGQTNMQKSMVAGETITVNNREDVVVVLDLICEYYSQHEPSSPLPLLLKRARSIVHKDFLGVLEELVPDSVSMTEPVFGRQDEDDS